MTLESIAKVKQLRAEVIGRMSGCGDPKCLACKENETVVDSLIAAASPNRDDIEHRLNTEDLYAEIQELFSNGEGRLGSYEMEKLVEYVVKELLTPLCPKCGFQEYPLRPHGDYGCPVVNA